MDRQRLFPASENIPKKVIPSLPAARAPTPPPLPSFLPEQASMSTSMSMSKSTYTPVSAESTATRLKRNPSQVSCSSLDHRPTHTRRTSVLSERAKDNIDDLETSEYLYLYNAASLPIREQVVVNENANVTRQVSCTLQSPVASSYGCQKTQPSFLPPPPPSNIPPPPLPLLVPPPPPLPHVATPPPLPPIPPSLMQSRNDCGLTAPPALVCLSSDVNEERRKTGLGVGIGGGYGGGQCARPPPPLSPPPLPAKSTPTIPAAYANATGRPLAPPLIQSAHSPPTLLSRPPLPPTAPPLPRFAPPPSPQPLDSVTHTFTALSSQVPNASLTARSVVPTLPAIASIQTTSVPTLPLHQPTPPPLPPSIRSGASYNGAGNESARYPGAEGLHESAEFSPSPLPLPPKQMSSHLAPSSRNAALSLSNGHTTYTQDSSAFSAASFSSASNMTYYREAGVAVPITWADSEQQQREASASATDGRLGANQLMNMNISAPLNLYQPVTTVMAVMPPPRIKACIQETALASSKSFTMSTFSNPVRSTSQMSESFKPDRTSAFTSTSAAQIFCSAKNQIQSNAAPLMTLMSHNSSAFCQLPNTGYSDVNSQGAALDSNHFKVMRSPRSVMSASSRSPSGNSNTSLPSQGTRPETESISTSLLMNSLNLTSLTTVSSSARSAHWNGRWEEHFEWHNVHELPRSPRIFLLAKP